MKNLSLAICLLFGVGSVFAAPPLDTMSFDAEVVSCVPYDAHLKPQFPIYSDLNDMTIGLKLKSPIKGHPELPVDSLIYIAVVYDEFCSSPGTLIVESLNQPKDLSSPHAPIKIGKQYTFKMQKFSEAGKVWWETDF